MTPGPSAPSAMNTHGEQATFRETSECRSLSQIAPTSRLLIGPQTLTVGTRSAIAALDSPVSLLKKTSQRAIEAKDSSKPALPTRSMKPPENADLKRATSPTSSGPPIKTMRQESSFDKSRQTSPQRSAGQILLYWLR